MCTSCTISILIIFKFAYKHDYYFGVSTPRKRHITNSVLYCIVRIQKSSPELVKKCRCNATNLSVKIFNSLHTNIHLYINYINTYLPENSKNVLIMYLLCRSITETYKLHGRSQRGS